jgi:ECF sigma factor/Protein tyrosine and serine/threonine kinase
MTTERPRPITDLLRRWRAGDRDALDALMPIVYEELRRLARQYLKREPSDHRLQGTALVHEAAGGQLVHERAVVGAAEEPAPNGAAARVGARIGPYVLLERIGRGGMGEVFAAVRADGQFEQKVALKLVRGGYASATVRDRFRAERQILAGFDHLNIARLLDGGTTDHGVPYIVMASVPTTSSWSTSSPKPTPRTDRWLPRARRAPRAAASRWRTGRRRPRGIARASSCGAGPRTRRASARADSR